MRDPLVEAPAELPPPTPELSLLRIHVEATIVALGPKRAQKYMGTLLEFAADDDSLSNVLPFRPPEERAKLERSRRSALFWLRQMLPVFFDRARRG
jgi:hypothetical protein